MHCLQRMIAAGALVLSMLCSGSAHAGPQNGWWWNPAESGRGFFIEIVGKTVFMAGYFYADDGRAKWLVSAGETTTAASYEGRLLSVAGGQTLLGDYHAPAAPVDAGAVSVQFIDDTHATLTWPGGTIPIERQVFGTGAAPVQPHIGWWWNEAESGRGYSIEVQGGFLFMVAFMYDASGNPLWYFTAGPMASETHFAGDVVQLSGGQTLAGPYHAPGAPLKVGTLTLDFTAPDEATLVVSDLGNASAQDAGTAMKGVKSKIILVTPQLPRVPPVKLPAKWDGELKQQRIFEVTGVGSVRDQVTLTATTSFVEDIELSPLDKPGKIYVPLGSVRINHVHTQRSAVSGCDSTMAPTTVTLGAADGTLTVHADGTFVLDVRKINMPYVINVDCYVTGIPTHFINDVAEIADLVIQGRGRVVYNQVQGAPPTLVVAEGTTLTTSWKLTGVD